MPRKFYAIMRNFQLIQEMMLVKPQNHNKNDNKKEEEMDNI